VRLSAAILAGLVTVAGVHARSISWHASAHEGPDESKNEARGEEERPAEKQPFRTRFKDPTDGKFDVTAGEKGAAGFLPVLIPFNEPAIGFGLVGAVAYFHPSKAPPDGSGDQEIPAPPSTTFAGGAYSDNGTWAAVAGHMGVWKDTEGAGIVQQAEVRLGKSRFFAGGRYAFSTTDTTFETDLDVDGQGATDNAGLTAFVSYDTRDTTFTPNRGTHAKLALSYFAEALGGDFNYGRFDLAGYQYWPLFEERLVLGLRSEYQHAGDDAPFYALPWVRLRGIPAFRNLGNYLVTGEIESRWKIDGRWSVLAFGGVGRAARHLDRLDDAERAYGFGTGFRYLLARKLGLAAGIDVARGPEETAAYIVFGSAWGF
jgi:hypothetical protein